MKRWAILTVLLYGAILALLGLPVLLVTSLEYSSQTHQWSLAKDLIESLEVYREWMFWLVLGVMLAGQALLLLVPLDLTRERPVSRRKLRVPVVTAGFLLGLTGLTGLLSLLCLFLGDGGVAVIWWSGERSEEIVWIASKGARLLEELASTRLAGVLRSAGDASLASQRIGHLHLFHRWALRSASIGPELKKANDAFVRAMEALHRAPESTPEIVAELQLAQNQYDFLAQAAGRLQGAREVRSDLEAVAKACDNILEVMDRVGRLYDAGKG